MDLPVLVAVIVALLWSIPPIVHRFLFKKEVSRDLILIISSITYFTATMLYLAFKNRGLHWVKDHVIRHRHYVPMLMLTTLFSLFIANLLYLYCVKHAANINIVNVVMATYPVITLVLAYMLLNERLHSQSLLGFCLVLVGMGIMLYTSHSKGI